MVNKQRTDLADYIGHIMVVDDDNITLKNVRRILEKEGHRVSTYNNPVRALETLEENCFDILLSDLSMPYLDGLELLEQAKRVHQDLEVIIITGFASLDKAVEATKKGAYHFLAKPFEPAQLREVVNQAIDQKTPPQHGAHHKHQRRARSGCPLDHRPEPADDQGCRNHRPGGPHGLQHPALW